MSLEDKMKQKSITRKITSLKKKTYLPIKQRLEQIIEMSKGAEYAEDVAEKVGIRVPTLINYSYKHKIKIPPLKDNKNRYSYINPKRDKKKDRLIRKGCSLGIIGKKTGVHREGIRQYILGTGQYEKWEQSRGYYKENKRKTENERKNAIGEILSQATALEKFRLKKECGWAYEKTEDYFRSLKKEGKFSFETIFYILKDYYELQEKGEKKSLNWFAKKYDTLASITGEIFNRTKLKPMINPHKKKRVVTPKYKKQALERAIEVEMPLGDITYFLELPYYVISQFYYLYKGDKKRPKVNSWIKQFGNPKSQRLTYHNASQIYEALDCGFSCQEIKNSYNVSQEVYNYAVENREKISEYIVNSLKIMFPDREIEKPYKEFRF